MLLEEKNLDGLFEKIAQSMTGSSYKSSASSKSSSSGYGGKSKPLGGIGSSDRLNLQSTISKSRDNADVQPLHNNSGSTIKPADRMDANKMHNKQNYLSGIEDKRITHNHLRRR